MPSYAVDSSKQPMIATGVVGVVPVWVERPDGGRRPTDEQARDEDTGMPLWTVEVMYQQTSFNRVSSVTAMVTVPSVQEPKPAMLTPVTFEGLRVDVRLTKAKQLVEAWSADGLIGTPATGRASKTGEAA
ncbi:hypothetical protein [Kineococcus auxinigenes]|uniref:hypothetical protein n=1 Tax=unclassified Kineococcus TaxID=2621656 RepID=UPI003D7DEA63